MLRRPVILGSPVPGNLIHSFQNCFDVVRVTNRSRCDGHLPMILCIQQEMTQRPDTWQLMMDMLNGYGCRNLFRIYENLPYDFSL